MFRFSDAHCDTISKILDENQPLHKNNCHVDAVRLKKQNNHIQFFAAWIAPGYEPCASIIRCLEIIDKFYFEIKENGMNIVRTVRDIEKGGALLSVEGGSARGGRLCNVRNLYRLGVRAITLTWNGRNELADGVGEGEKAGGLSGFGRCVVREMNRLGMIVDVSHLSPKGFWDVSEISLAPFIASHSNAKKLCNHYRNLSDEQISDIIKKNGFIGINFCPDFLNDKKATIKDIIKHIEYILSLGGENTVGFGADFDGVDNLPEGINGVEDMEKVFSELAKLNYPSRLINNILYDNLHNAIKRIFESSDTL
jgi:membrane dipeptidase